VLSGGPAPGGHNVIFGLYKALLEMNPRSQLIGYRKGFIGLMDDDYKEITPQFMMLYRNMGGFDMLRKTLLISRFWKS